MIDAIILILIINFFIFLMAVFIHKKNFSNTVRVIFALMFIIPCIIGFIYTIYVKVTYVRVVAVVTEVTKHYDEETNKKDNTYDYNFKYKVNGKEYNQPFNYHEGGTFSFEPELNKEVTIYCKKDNPARFIPISKLNYLSVISIIFFVMPSLGLYSLYTEKRVKRKSKSKE